MHLFLLSINNSGSSILYEKIRQSKYTTTLPFIQAPVESSVRCFMMEDLTWKCK